MNKIIVNNNEHIIINQDSVNLNLNDNHKITIFDQSLKSLKIKVGNNAEVIINDFRIITQEKTDIEFIIDEGAKLTFNHAFINVNNYDLKIKANLKNNKGNIIINIHGFNQGTNNIQIDGIIGLKKIKNELLENIKIINSDRGKCEVIPNMLISNNEVIANHYVTIGKINEEELAYLMSKGINEEKCEKLIINGFLIKVIDDQDLLIKIKEILQRR